MAAQSLSVNSPGAGVTWNKGTTHNITWTSPGCQSGDVKINIFKNSTDPANFVEQLTGPNTGSKSWTIPNTFQDGNYIIRVKTDPAEEGCFGDSGLFTIEEQSQNKTLSVTNPQSGTEWTRGALHDITWTSSGCTDQNVKINIFRNSVDPVNFIEQLTSTLNTGFKSWAIQNSYVPGNYIIRIKTEDANCIGDSSIFKIVEQPAVQKSIKLISPTSMWSFNAGGNMTIKWSSTGISGKGLVIRLVSADNSFNVIIKDNHPYNGCPLRWTIPDNIAQGKYHIDITQDNITAQSGNFTINAKTSNINVLEPIEGVTRLKGKVCTITWHSTNVDSDKVVIRLNPRSGTLSQHLCIIHGHADNKEGRNTYAWTIPSQIPDGKYTVSVEKPDGSVKGESGQFGIGMTRVCDLAIESAEFCGSKLDVIVKNNGSHYSGKITILLIYDMFGKTRVSIPAIVKDNFLLFSGKSLTLTEKNFALYNAIYACSMNYILMLVPDKDHKDNIGGNNQYNGVAFKDCNVRECNKPDLSFSKVWIKKKYRNSVVHTGKNQKILAELVKAGKINGTFTTKVTVYYHKLQFDPWIRVTENRWRLGDFNNKKELSFTFKPQNAGYYVFEWITDIHDEIKERNENNNKKSDGENIMDPR